MFIRRITKADNISKIIVEKNPIILFSMYLLAKYADEITITTNIKSFIITLSLIVKLNIFFAIMSWLTAIKLIVMRLATAAPVA